MKENETNEWIDKVLASAKGKDSPQVSPFLFTRIEQQFSSLEISSNPNSPIRWAMAAIVLLILNIGAVLYTTSPSLSDTTSTETYQQLSESYFESDSTQTVFYASF